jgi:uncharacterized protein YjbI with pentapeptide repeats
MFRIAGILTILLVFGFCSEVVSKTSQKKYPHPIFIPFEQNCIGNKDKKLSDEFILQIRKAHSKWLENPTASDGYRANFCEADLVAADFRMAMLKGADFRMAMLAGANFTKAKLHKAQMDGANLTRANFSESQLQGANLDNAMLHLAILHKAILQDASLQHAMLYQANLQGADLSNVKGLTQYQINMACLDQHTKLPPGLSRPKPCS